MLIFFDSSHFVIGIGILVILLPLLWWQKHSLPYLVFFSIFWLYLLAVVQEVFFPFAIDVDYNNATFRPNINLIPFYFGDCSFMEICTRQIFQNIAFTIPFGFGINFLTAVKTKKSFLLALGVGLGFEFSQLMISLATKNSFRVIDVNDVLLNAAGILLGYGFFKVFALIYRKLPKQLLLEPTGFAKYIDEMTRQ